MSNFISFVDSYAVNALWQVPLVGAAGWAASWLLKRLGPQAQHVVWVATLLLAVLTPAVPRWHWHASAYSVEIAREERALAAASPISHPAVVAPVNSVPFSVVPPDASLPDVSVASRRPLAAWPRVVRSAVVPTPPVLDGSVPLDFAVAGPAVPFVARPAAPADASGVTLLPVAVVFALLLCYLGALLYFAARFGWSLYRVALLEREAEPLCFDAESETVWAQCREMFVLGEVRTLLSQGIVGPVTIGFHEPVLLVPVGFVERCSVHDLLATLGHECAHIRRHDFQKNLIYEAASLLIAFHPVTWLLKRQIAQTREMVCDGRAVERLIDVQHYVQALLRLAAAISGGAMGSSSPAIGIFDGNILEQRILTMKIKRQRVSTARRCGLVLAGAAVLAGVVTAGSARAVAVEAKANAGALDAKTPMSAKAIAASAFQAVVEAAPAPVAKILRAAAALQGKISVDANLPDKRLYDMAMDSMKAGHYGAAIVNLQTLLNTYRDSEYQMRAKLGIADCWFKESDAAALDQAESEYKNFITFYPNTPEAAQAQLRVGDIYFREMDKPDRDYTKAEGAEENYRLMLQQFPDASPELRKQATQKLRDVQEVLAERDAEIGAFYSSHQSWPAAIARLQTVVDLYPEYSHMDAVRRALSDARAAMPQVVPDESSDAINVSWVQLQELNPDMPPSQQKSAVLQLDGKTVSIPGFMVPLADGVTSVNEFLLIPYRGASIHVPPPPPNQMVYVKMNGDASLPVTTDPILVTGRFKISTVISPYGDLSYVMTGMTVKPYTSPDAIAPQNQLNGTYKKWVDEDVRWIISDQEMAAFAALSSDEERDQFIQNFWQRRNPTPDSKVNPYREEYYQRIAFANQRYAYGSVPGWKSDRGMIYIKFGRPDKVDSHPAEGQYTRPAQEGGGTTVVYPFEVWHYRSLAGIGDNIDIEFVDTCRCGEYHATVDRSEKDALNQSKEFDRLDRFAKLGAPPPIKFKDLEEYMVPSKVLTGPLFPFDVRIDYMKATNETVTASLTLRFRNKDITYNTKGGVSTGKVEIQGQVSNITHKPIQSFGDMVPVSVASELLTLTQNNMSVYRKSLPLAPGQYRIVLVIKDVNNPDHIGRWSIDINVPKDEDIQPAAPAQMQPNQVPIPGHPDVHAGPEILSDAQGVDFSAYMRRLHDDIERNWYPLIPEEVHAPHLAKGITGIRFKILPDGEISGVTLETRSGNTALDKAAWSAIVSEGKFQPLPKEFHGPNIELRCGFYYNVEPPQAVVAPVPGQVRTMAVAYSPQAFASTTAQQGPVHVSGDVIKAMLISCPPIAYPRDARQAHVQGEVVMHVTLSKDGSVKDLQVISGPELLRGAAMDAVRTWKYKPYLQGGMPAEVDTTVTVNFTMGG